MYIYKTKFSSQMINTFTAHIYMKHHWLSWFSHCELLNKRALDFKSSSTIEYINHVVMETWDLWVMEREEGAMMCHLADITFSQMPSQLCYCQADAKMVGPLSYVGNSNALWMVSIINILLESQVVFLLK